MCRGIKPGPLFWAYAGSQSRGVGPWRVIIALPSNYVLEPIKGGGVAQEASGSACAYLIAPRRSLSGAADYKATALGWGSDL